MNKEEAKALLTEVKENRRRREECDFHDFQRMEPDNIFSKYYCPRCGCTADSFYRDGYLQGLKHGGAKVEES